MVSLGGRVDAFNNGGDDEPFPASFDVPPNDHAYAESIANDPTAPLSGACR